MASKSKSQGKHGFTDVLFGTFKKTQAQLEAAQSVVEKNIMPRNQHGVPIGLATLDEEHPLGFIMPMFQLHKNPALTSNKWEIAFGILLMLLIKFCATEHLINNIPSDIKNMKAVLGVLLAYLLTMRANASKKAYFDGRGHLGNMMNGLRQIMINLYTLKVEDVEDPTEQIVEAEHIRRYCNILFGFIRQAMRESKHGMNPKHMKNLIPTTESQRDMKTLFEEVKQQSDNVDILKKHYTEDPTMPLMGFLLHDEEYQGVVDHELFGNVPPPIRPSLAAMRLQTMLKNYISKHSVATGGIEVHHQMAMYEDQITLVLNHWKGCMKIIDHPIPFVYTHMCNTLIFIYVFSTPLIYISNFTGTPLESTKGWLAQILLVITYYGLNKVSAMLQDPFGWMIVCDHDLEGFGIKVHEESYWLARQRKRPADTDSLILRFYQPCSEPVTAADLHDEVSGIPSASKATV